MPGEFWAPADDSTRTEIATETTSVVCMCGPLPADRILKDPDPMRLWIALCAAALVAAGTSFDARQPQGTPAAAGASRLPDRAERIVDYRIGVKLHHEMRQLIGQQRLDLA